MQPKVKQLAELNQLGKLVGEFKGRTTFFAISSVFTVVAGLLLVMDSQTDSQLYTGIVFLGVGCYVMYQTIQTLGLQLLLYEQGLICVRFNRIQVVRYEDIVAIWQHIIRNHTYFIPTRTDHNYTIQTRDSKILKFDDKLKKVGQVGNYLQNEVFRYQMPLALKTYHQGGEVDFGPLTVSKNGLTSMKGTLQWSEIKNIKVENGAVLVKRNGSWLNWMKIEVRQIPNFYIFLAMVEHSCGIKFQ